MGAGLSGHVSVLPSGAVPASADPAGTPDNAARAANLSALAIAPGVAPWVGGRIGLVGSNEAGLTYAGRAIRLDGRHAFKLGEPSTLSVGLGASAIIARRPESTDSGSVYGGGFDIPVLFGYTSAADIYSFWAGPRGGFEILSGSLVSPAQAPGGADPVEEKVGARRVFAGFVAGARVGFRHVHVALELSGAYQFADGELGDLSMTINQFTLTPAGALLISF